MKGLEQFLVPYLISQLFAIVILLAACKNTRVARSLFALLFIWASATNMYLGLTSPDIYLNYSEMALPFYRDFIVGVFSKINHVMVPLIAVGQLLIGVSMLLKDWWVKLACIGAIIFLVSITPLMIGSGFPFTIIIVSLAAFIVLKKDQKAYLWKKISNANKAANNTSLKSAFYLSISAGVLALIALCVGIVPNRINPHDS